MRLLALALVITPAVAAAQTSRDVTLTIGVGARSQPGYFGAAENEVGATGRLTFGEVSIGDIPLGDSGTYSLGVGGSLRYVSARKAADYSELAGLTDIDAALELGVGLTLFAPGFQVFGRVRNGIGGHDAIVSELGGDLIYRPNDQWFVRAGPRVLWGSGDYAQTYFGVTPAEAAASSFAAYDAGPGMISAGVGAEVTYQFTPDWGVLGIIGYSQLQGDAAASPIVAEKDQFSASLMITRQVSFSF